MKLNISHSNFSNTVFIYPILFATFSDIYVGAVLNLGLLISSFLYHNSQERHFLRLDKTFSYLCIIYNLYLCYLFNFALVPFGTALVFLLFGLYFYYHKNKKDIYHPLWHVCCAAITLSCFSGFIFYK